MTQPSTTSSADAGPSALWPSLPALALTPLVLLLVLAVLCDAPHRVPSVLALAFGAVPIVLDRRRRRVLEPARRLVAEAAALAAVGGWLAVALWAVLAHHG